MIDASISYSLLSLVDKRIKNRHSKYDEFSSSLFDYCKDIIQYEAGICKEEILPDMICKSKEDVLRKVEHLQGEYVEEALPFITGLVNRDLINVVDYLIPCILSSEKMEEGGKEWISTLAFIAFTHKKRMAFLKTIHKYDNQWMKYSNLTFFTTHITLFNENDEDIAHDIFTYKNYALNEKMSLDNIHNFPFVSVLKSMAQKKLIAINGNENVVRIFSRASMPIISCLHDYTTISFQGCEAAALRSGSFLRVAFLINERLFRMKRKLVYQALLSDNPNIVKLFYNHPNCRQWVESIVSDQLKRGNMSLLLILEEIHPERDFSFYVPSHKESDRDKALLNSFRKKKKM